MTEIDQPLAADEFVRALADADRLRIAAAMIEQERTIDDLARSLRLRPADVSRHLTRLIEAGLAAERQDGRTRHYRFDVDALHALRRAALSTPRAAAPEPEEGSDAWERKVLRAFFDGERLKDLPAARNKRLVVLKWLAGRFEPRARYPEREVNEILKRYHPDVASLRRELVDNRFMEREQGVYWRTPSAPAGS